MRENNLSLHFETLQLHAELQFTIVLSVGLEHPDELICPSGKGTP